MERELKRKLLTRKFSSIEYMEEMREWHQKAIDSLTEALRSFYRYPPQHEDWHNWHKSDWPETWEKKVLTNLNITQASIDDGIAKARNGDSSYIESVAAEIHGIFRNLDNVSWGWWKHIPRRHEDGFRVQLGHARDIASNVMDTLSGYWKGDEILDEEITGVFDEADILRYLKPGENS